MGRYALYFQLRGGEVTTPASLDVLLALGSAISPQIRAEVSITLDDFITPREANSITEEPDAEFFPFMPLLHILYGGVRQVMSLRPREGAGAAAHYGNLSSRMGVNWFSNATLELLYDPFTFSSRPFYAVPIGSVTDWPTVGTFDHYTVAAADFVWVSDTYYVYVTAGSWIDRLFALVKRKCLLAELPASSQTITPLLRVRSSDSSLVDALQGRTAGSGSLGGILGTALGKDPSWIDLGFAADLNEPTAGIRSPNYYGSRSGFALSRYFIQTSNTSGGLFTSQAIDNPLAPWVSLLNPLYNPNNPPSPQSAPFVGKGQLQYFSWSPFAVSGNQVANVLLNIEIV